MTAQEFLIQQIEFTAKQVEKSVAGLDESQFDAKANEHGMTIRDMLEHLCETYTAFLKKSDGQPHEWGSYSLSDKSSTNLISNYRALRTQAAKRIEQGIPDEMLLIAFEFMPQHDSYHIGQICAARFVFDPQFDPYSIYKVE